MYSALLACLVRAVLDAIMSVFRVWPPKGRYRPKKALTSDNRFGLVTCDQIGAERLVGDIFASRSTDDVEGPQQELFPDEPAYPLDENKTAGSRTPTWREVCEEFPDELEGFAKEEEESSEGDSEAGTLSEELHERIAAAAVRADEAALDDIRKEYTGGRGGLGSLSEGASVAVHLFQSAINKLRPVTPLMAAAAAGKAESVQWLLARGAKADIRCGPLAPRHLNEGCCCVVLCADTTLFSQGERVRERRRERDRQTPTQTQTERERADGGPGG